mgnify:FL=1
MQLRALCQRQLRPLISRLLNAIRMSELVNSCSELTMLARRSRATLLAEIIGFDAEFPRLDRLLAKQDCRKCLPGSSICRVRA